MLGTEVALAKWDGDGTIAVGAFSLMRIGLLIEGEPTYEEWEQVGKFLSHMEGAVHWWVGDWLNEGERRWGEKYTQAMAATGFEYQTIADDKWAARSVPFSFRKETLSHAHHKQVASLGPDDMIALLNEAESEGLSVAQLRERARPFKAKPVGHSFDGCTVDDLQKLIAKGVRFGTIYADPPWQYDNQATRAATDNHYPTMSIEELAALPVLQLAAEISHLHLWTTDSFLEPAIGLLKGWGFERRQTFIWCKPQLGIGNYWRSNHEYMLLGIRGGLTFPDESAMKSWIELPRTKHSQKPMEIRKLIERVSPGPRLELFGRCCVDGWTVWGNQISRDMFDHDVEAI